MRLHLRFIAVLPLAMALVVVAAWFALCRGSEAARGSLLKSEDYAVGVPSPVDISFGLGGMLITSLGSGRGDGAIYVARPDGDGKKAGSLTKVVDRLPSASLSGSSLPFLPFVGATAAVAEDQAIDIVVSDRGASAKVLRAPLQTGAEAKAIADLASQRDPSGAPSVPFDMVRATDGTLFISDARAGAVFRVTARGAVSPYARFDSIRPPDGEAFAPVPTGLAFGPDGALYVALFSGEPYAPGRSRIYRLRDRDASADALGAGERIVAAADLTFCIALAFGPDGQLYALEYATSLDGGRDGGPTPGRLWRLGERKADLLADDLVTPVALIIDGRGDAYVAERATGKVRVFRGAAPPPQRR